MPRPSNQCFQFDVGAGFIPPSALEVGEAEGGMGSDPNFANFGFNFGFHQACAGEVPALHMRFANCCARTLNTP